MYFLGDRCRIRHNLLNRRNIIGSICDNILDSQPLFAEDLKDESVYRSPGSQSTLRTNAPIQRIFFMFFILLVDENVRTTILHFTNLS